jgi:hypothetical protein
MSGKSAAQIAIVLEKSYASVSSKIKRLDLQVDDDGLSGNLLSSTLELPDELPSVETVLKKTAAACARKSIGLECRNSQCEMRGRYSNHIFIPIFCSRLKLTLNSIVKIFVIWILQCHHLF